MQSKRVNKMANRIETRRKLLKKIGVVGSTGIMVATAGCLSGGTDDENLDDINATDDEDVPDSEIRTGGTLTIGVDESFGPLDPRKASRLPFFTTDIFTNPFVLNNDGEIIPYMVTNQTVEEDGTELVWDLMEGVTFHDGSDFDAEYLQWFMMNYLLEGAGTAYVVEDNNVSDVVVEDSHRVRVSLESPAPNFLWDLTSAWGTMHSREAVEEFGQDYGTGTNVAGAGPYQVAERDANTFMRLERFEDWDWPRPDLEDIDRPRADAIEYQVFSDAATISSAFEAGDIDGMLQAVPSNKVGSYNNNPDFEVKAPRKSSTFDFTFFNMDPDSSNDPIVAEDLSLRKAISYALDRESMVDVNYTSRTAEPWSTYATPVVPSAQVDDEFRYDFDLDEARNVMEEGGWNVEPDGTSTKDGREASFELNSWNDTLSRQRAQVIQEMLQEIGVQVDVVPIDFATAQERGENGDFTAIMYSAWTWGNANTLWWLNDGSLIDNYFACTRSTVQFPQVQELLDNARAATTWEDRIERYTELHEFLLENVVPMISEAALLDADAHKDTIFDWNAAFSEYGGEYIWDENW